MSNKSIGEKIKILRNNRGITQTELGEMLNVKRNTISQWEQNERTPSFEKIKDICNALGVTLDYFQEEAPERTIHSIMAQLEAVFMNAEVPAADKDKAYQDIMKIYLKSKDKE